MEIKKTDQVKIVSLWVLALCLPIFWHSKAQNPFLFSKELFFRFYILIFLSILLWNYNKFLSVFLIYSLGFVFLKLSTRSLWALGNLRDFFLYYLILRIFLEKINWKQCLYPYLISLLIIIAVSLAQFFNFDITKHGTYLYYGEYWKIAGFFGNSHILKTWIGICSPIAFLLPKFWRYLTLMIIFSFLIFLRKIAPGYGGLTIAVLSCGIILFALSERKKKWLLLNILILIIITICLNPSSKTRIEILKQSIPKIMLHPVIGNGLNSFGEAGITISSTPELQAHNDPLQFIYEYGLTVGGTALMVFLGYYFFKLKSIENKLTKAMLSGLFYGFIYYSNFSFPFHMAHSAILFLTIIAIIDDTKSKEAQRCGFYGSPKTLLS